jgi:hypothetical protein
MTTFTHHLIRAYKVLGRVTNVVIPGQCNLGSGT